MRGNRDKARHGHAAVAGTERRRNRSSLMSDDKIYDEPSKVTVEDGAIAVDGPDGVDVTFTADAADETSQRLLEASMKARGLRRIASRKRRNDEAT